MSRDVVSIQMVSIECEHAINDTKEVPEMLRRAFAAAKKHWMVLDEDPQFKGALNAVLVKMGEEHPERERLMTEIRLLGQFAAWLSAAQQGLSVVPPELPEGFEAYGLRKLWQEAA